MTKSKCCLRWASARRDGARTQAERLETKPDPVRKDCNGKPVSPQIHSPQHTETKEISLAEADQLLNKRLEEAISNICCDKMKRKVLNILVSCNRPQHEDSGCKSGSDRAGGVNRKPKPLRSQEE